MAPPTDESGFLSEEEFLTGIAKPKPPKVGEPREPIKVEGGQSEEEFLAEVDTPKPKVEAPRPELFDPVEAAGGWDAFQEAQDKLAVEAPEEVPEEGPHKQVSEEEAYQSGWITRHQATVEEPNHRELTSIGFAQTVDTATGELLPIYDEQALITLRAEREASFQEAVKERREESFTERLARVGDVDDRGGRSADFLAKKLNEWFGSVRADWAREAAIKEQAKEQGFDSLSQEDVEWMEENEPEELERIHAVSVYTHGEITLGPPRDFHELGYETIEEKIGSDAETLQEIFSPEFFPPTWAEGEEFDPKSSVYDLPPTEEYSSKWEGVPWEGLSDDEARVRAINRMGYTLEGAQRLIGKDSRIEDIREKKREAIENRKEKTAEIWQEITQDEKADLHRLVKDTKIVDYIDDKGRLDFQAYEDAIVPKLAEEMIAEDLGENIHFLSPELSPAMRNYYLNKAEQKWYLQKKMILSVGKGGLPFFDVDAKRTNKKIVEALKGLDKAPDMLLRDIPALAETAESLGIENWALYQVTDPLLALTIVGAPIAAMSLIPKELTGGYQMSGTKALAEGIKYNPLTLPIISATTPSYAMDFSPTHQQMVGRTMLDSLNAWFVTTWIAAAQRTNADIIAGEGGVPRSAESMEYSDAFFEAFTADGITKASESQLPAIYAAARAGDEKAIGWGLAKYILSRDPVFGRIAMAPKAALGALSMVADTYVRAIGATGDDINTELAIRNLRQGNMLFMVHDQLANDFCDSLELHRGDPLRSVARRTQIATGLVAEFTPITGADPLTASIGVMGSTIKKVRGTRSFLQKSAEKLRKIRLRDDLSAQQKLDAIDKLDPAIGQMVRANVRIEAEYSGQTVRFLQDQERVLDQALELAEQTAREAGLESSPAILAGSKFRNKGYADRYVEVEVRRATKEPGVLAEAAGRAPPRKSFQEEFGEVEDIVLQLEAEGVTLPLGFRTWDQGRQEAYIWELRKTQIGEAVRARAEARVALDLEQAGERIGRTTVTGDVYRVEGQAYMRIGAEGPDAVWVPVREADIPKMRELAVDEALTTHTPLRPVEWKSALTGEWVSRPRGAMETPWGEVALARQEVDSQIRGIRAAISSEKKAGRDALIGDLQDQLIAAKARAKELEAQEIALRKTFPDYEVPDPRLREAPTELDEGAIQFYEAKRQNMLDYWNRRLRGSEEALTKATKAQDAEAQELAEAAVARYREEIRIVTAKTPIKIRDDIYQLLGNPAVWRTNGEMVGGTAVSVRKPVIVPTSRGTEEALRAEADVILQETALAQAELRTLEREYKDLMAGEGSAYEVATGLERLLAQNAKEVRRLEKRVAKLEEKLAPRLEKGGKLKHQVDLAEAKLGHKKAKWQKDKNLFNRRAMKSAEKEVEAAHAKLEKFAQKEMFPLEAEIKSLNKEIAAQANARIVYESQLLGSKAGGPGLRQYLPTDDQRAIGIFQKRVERNVKRAERKVAELERAYLAKSKEARIEGNAQLKAISTMVRENIRASTASEKLSVFDRVLSRLAKDIDEGTQAIKRIPKAQEAFNEALEKATVSFAEKGGRELDVELFVGRMEATFTRPALERAAELGGEGSRLIRKLLDEADANKVLRETGIEAPETLSLSLRESMVIQQVLPHLSRGWKLTHAASRGINIVEAIKIAQRDPDLSINSWRRLMESTAQTRLKDMFDPIRQEIGEVSSRVAQVVKGVEHLQDHLRDELYMLGMHIESMARKNNCTMTQRFDNHQRMVLQYLTEAEGLAIYRTRSTYFNTGDSSIWEQALWQLKNDPTTLGKSRLIEMAKAEQGIMKRQVAKGDLPADTAIPTVEKLMERRWGKGVLELADEGDGAVARALSRLFLPQGKWGGLSSMKSRKLYEATLDALHASDNLAEVLLRIEEATLKLKFEAYPNKVEALQRAAFALGHAAIENRANHMFTRAITGRITPDQASDIRRLMDHTPEEIKDYDGALEALNRIGMPFTAKRVKMREFGPTKAANTERDLKVIATGADDQGQTFFMPQQIAEKIASTMPKVTKEVTERFVESRGTWDMLKTGAEFEALSLWKTSVVTGIVIPRPTYFWNNFIGDLSQVWLNQGFNTAVRMNKNLIHTISLNSLEAIHPAIRKRLSRMETHNIEKYGPDRAQGSIWNAMFNPVANRVWRGENGVLRTAGGREYSYQQLRRIMEEEGILDTMIHAELLDTWHRLTPDRWKNMPVLGKAAEGVEGSRHAISSFATFVQQRQRGNLFLDLVRRGKTPQEAGKLVRESLYDWKHGLAQWEVATIGRVSPFYRFWKLAFRQTAAAILDPMVSMERGMMRSLTGQTGLKRIHQQWATSQAWPHMWNPEEYSAYQDMAEKYDAAARYLRPSWARMRAVSFVRKNELDRINHLQSLRGKAMGYSMSVMPPMTALDLTELMGCLSFGMLFAGLDDSDLAPWGGKVPGDSESRFWGPILDLVFPHVGEPLEQYLLDRGVDTGGFPLGKRRRISESQKFILDTIGVGTWRGQAIGGAMGAVVGAGKARGGVVPGTTKILGHAALGAAVMSFPAGEAGYHPEYHYPEADAGTVAYLEKIPFFGTELPALLDAAWFKNTKMQQAWHSDSSGFGDYLDGMGKFVSTFSGMAKEVPFSPEDTKKFRRRGYQKQIRDSAAEAGIEDALRARERDPKIKIKSLRQRVMEEDLKQRLQEREDREK